MIAAATMNITAATGQPVPARPVKKPSGTVARAVTVFMAAYGQRQATSVS
jgi:hypothetical protein